MEGKESRLLCFRPMAYFRNRNDLSLQAIYDFFCNLDKEEKGYILDVTNGVKILYETVAKLICHPLQRSPQNEAYHNLTSASPEQSAAERP